MRISHELVRLFAAFDAAGVRALALKGPALAVRCGDDPDSRPVSDLDVLVAPRDVGRAGEVLAAHGLRARPRSNGLIREIHFLRERPPLCVDLHWHLVPAHIGFPLRFDVLWSERNEVSVHGRPVPVPSDEWQLLFAALYCVREAPLVEHRYFRDLVRIAELLRDADAWERVRERARATRAVRMVAVATRVAHARCGRPLPRAFVERFPETGAVRRAVDELLARVDDPRAAHKRRFFSYFAHFFVHGRYREHLFDRLRPILLFPLFLVLPEDDDVDRAERSGRPALLERLLRVGEVVSAVRVARAESRSRERFRAALADPSTRLRPAADVELHLLGERGVLFAAGAGELYALTTAASWVWCALCEGWTLGEMEVGFAASFAVSPERARADIGGLLGDWWEAGLLAGAPRPPRATPPSISGSEIRPSPPPVRVERLRILDTLYEVGWSHPGLAERCLPLLRHWIVPSTPEAAVPVRVFEGEGHDAGCWFVTVADTVAETALAPDELAPQVKSALLVDAVNRAGFELLLHAAMLVREGRALLLPAPPGSGKTCLSLALARRGFAYVSDETVLLSGDPLRARGVPVCATVKEPARELVLPLYPDLDWLPVHRRVDGRHCRYLPPPSAGSAAQVPEPKEVGWLVFPHYRAGADVTLEPLAPVDALAALLGECTAIGTELDSDLVRRLVDWLRHLPAFRLEFGDLHAACARLDELTATAAPAEPSEGAAPDQAESKSSTTLSESGRA